jgi:hypothetical protein
MQNLKYPSHTISLADPAVAVFRSDGISTMRFGESTSQPVTDRLKGSGPSISLGYPTLAIVRSDGISIIGFREPKTRRVVTYSTIIKIEENNREIPLK